MDCASWIGADKEPSVVSGYLPTTIELTPRRGTIRTATTGLDAVDGESKTGCPVGDIAAPEPGVVRVIADFVGVAYATLASCLRSCGASALVTSGGDAGNSTACGQPKHRLHPQQEQRHKQRESVRRARDPARFGDAEDGRCGGCVVASLPALCAGVVAVLCYLNSLDGEFVHDDMVAVVGNPDVTGEHHRPRMQRSPSPLWVNDFWGRPMADPQSHKSYRPLTVFSFRANFLASGLHVRSYHIVNVALHAACSALVAAIAQSAVGMQPLPAGLAAVLFAAHPVHTEAVSSIVGRAELLCCLFFLLSFICYHRCTDPRYVVTGGKAAMWLAACGLLAACALLSKEQGISVLPLCITLRLRTLYAVPARHPSPPQADDTGPHTSRLRREWWFSIHHRFLETAHSIIRDTCLVTLTGLFALLLSFRLWMLGGVLPHFSEMDNPASFSQDFLTRLLTYAYLCAFNAWLTLCPNTLSYDWQLGSISLLTSLFDLRNLATLALFATLAALAWRALKWPSEHNQVLPEPCWHCCEATDGSCKKDEGPLLPVLVTCLSFLPASNVFVPVGFVAAERVLYIPSIGVCLLVGQGLSRIRAKGLALGCWCVVATCALVMLFAVRTLDRNSVWASREALFESGIRDAPQNAKMHYNYANLQKDLGNSALAIDHYERALRLWPEHASAHNNLGTLMTSPEDAEHHYRQALRINPSHPGAHYNLATLCNNRGEDKLAEMLLWRAVELDPDFCEAYSLLATLAGDHGSTSQSEKLHRLALTSDPRNADARNNYGMFLQAQGRSEEAVMQYQRALELQPNHTAALLNAARSLRSMKLNIQAESVYKRALSVEPDAQVMDSLAVFYINAGRLDEARQVYEEAQRLFPDHLDSKVHHVQLLMRTRSFGDAEKLLLEVLRQNSTHREALHQAALLYNHINRTALSLDYILKALRLCASDDRSCARLHAEHGDILKDLGDLGSSAQSYLLAIRLDPNLAHAHLNLAVIRHLQADYSAAFRHYQTAFSLDPKNPLIVDNMAKLRRRLTHQWASHSGVKGPCNVTVSS